MSSGVAWFGLDVVVVCGKAGFVREYGGTYNIAGVRERIDQCLP